MKNILNLSTINPNLLSINYAIGGAIETRAFQIKEDLKKGTGSYPFKTLTETHKANPKLYGFPSFSFYRQVLSILLNPQEMKKNGFSNDIKKRADYYLNQIDNNVGSSSPASGYGFIRENVANFVRKNSGVKLTKDDVILSEGSCNAIHLIFSTIINEPNNAIMVPSPNFPLITSLVSLNNGKLVYYTLDEENEWQFDLKDIEHKFKEAEDKGIKIKAIFLINPGNPTAKVIRAEKLQELIKFCWQKRIVVLSDEVYQDNVYSGAKFVSIMEALNSMPKPMNKLEVFCFNSTSKGLISEAGIRGGYVAMANVDPEVKKCIHQLKSIYMCSNTVGQIMVDLMVNPPAESECEEATCQTFREEKNNFLQILGKRAEIANDWFSKMKNITCQNIEATFYAFPKVKIGFQAIETAFNKKMSPDLFYAMEALEKTGIMLVPGCGFQQRDGTHHFRMTPLILPENILNEKMKELHSFNNWFQKEYC